jgi:hypothetical protein
MTNRSGEERWSARLREINELYADRQQLHRRGAFSMDGY